MSLPGPRPSATTGALGTDTKRYLATNDDELDQKALRQISVGETPLVHAREAAIFLQS